MCGIVGYLGPLNPKDVIIEGLRALEYRGYDSAGIAILDGDHFKRVRAEGKLSNLEEKLKGEKFSGHLGIGHTRWATHGKPAERNAHPHYSDGVSIVHNGIIENYLELREELKSQGSVFESETDSELVAHLLARSVKKTGDLVTSVLEILPRLRGAYSILAVWEKQKETMVAFKNGPPLVLGLGEDCTLVASDVQALVSHTKKVIYLEDNEIAVVQGRDVKVIDPTGKKLNPRVVTVDWTQERAQKQGFKHFMLKEIFEQPRAVAAALAPHLNPDKHQVNLQVTGKVEALDQFDRILIIACGTSFYAGLVAEYMIEQFAGIPVECDIASEFRYRDPVISPKTLAVVISQSGETADTLAALRMMRERGVPVMSLCNVKNSSIDREADLHLYMNAGVEVGVASTKAFSATLAVLSAFALDLAKRRKKLDSSKEQESVRGLLAAPALMETVLAYNKYFAEASKTLQHYRGFLYMGRGRHFPIALEGALKMKELAYKHAEGYAAGEMKHGPLALIDNTMAVVMMAPHDELFEKTVSNLEEVRARGAQLITIGTGQDSKLVDISEHYLAMPEANPFVLPILEVIPLQLMAYHVADALGHDVDQPRNLAKSVTVE